MPGRCCVCSKSSEDGRTLHRFPIDNEPILEKWLKATGMDYVPENSVLCSSHFEEHCFHPDRDRCQLKINAVPTLFTELQMADSTVGGPIIVKSEEFASDVNVNHPDEACENRVTAPFCEVYVDDASAFSPTICDSTKRGPTSNFEERKRKRLSIEDKLKVISRVEAGETHSAVADSFGIARQTVTYLHKHRKEISDQARNLQNAQGSLKKKKYTGVEESEFEKVLFEWFVQERELGTPISGSTVQQVARLINEQFGGSNNFVASAGWLWKFQKRHGIRQFSMQGKKVSSGTSAFDTFSEEIKKFIEENEYSLDNIYNADETGLRWKSLPEKSASNSETISSEAVEDRISVMTCANASGTHRIPLFVIGKARPRCLEKAPILPVVYAEQKNASIDRALFMKWFTTVFIEEVRSKKAGQKILLLLDNAPSHPSAEELNAIDPLCQVKYLPPHVTPLIQPMEQGVTVALKRLYKTAFVRERFLLNRESEQTVEVFIKSWNLIKCFDILAASWENLSSQTLQNAWNNIFHSNIEDPIDDSDEVRQIVNQALQDNFTREEISEWLDNDRFDHGWEVKTVDELISIAKNRVEHSNDADSDNDSNVQSVEDDIPSNRKAAESARKLYQWYSSRLDGNAEHLKILGYMKDMVSQAAFEDFCNDIYK